MSTYKKLNKQDAFITTYTAHKEWLIYGNELANYGIEIQSAGSAYTLESLQQLYYRNKDNEGRILSHSYELYNQTTLFYSSSRNLTTGSLILSIPREIYGTAIEPGTFRIEYGSQAIQLRGISGSFVSDEFIVDTPGTILNTAARPPSGEDPSDPGGPVIVRPPGGGGAIVPAIILDDGEGNLYLSGSNVIRVGDIIYPHGMVIITNPKYWSIVGGMLYGDEEISGEVLIYFKNTHPVFTHNYHCRIRESEYNYTYNNTAVSSSIERMYDNDGNLYSNTTLSNNGVLRNKVTGSAFQPYITTVGLYNDANQLIAVGKMGQPIPKSANTEMTIIVKIDI